jgi:ComF family protein
MSFVEKAGKLWGLDNLLEFVFPSLCLICSESTKVPGDLICSDCWKKASALPSVTCSRCRGTLDELWKCPNCDPGDYFPIASLGNYIDPLKEIIHQFKYGGYHKLGYLLAESWLKLFCSNLENFKINCVIPIPLDSYREKKRGFNQAAILSDIITERLNLVPADISLIKVRRTKDQTKLNPERREKNMREAFQVDYDRYESRNILLVDDVVTTGATIREAARTLSAIGMKPLMAATIAVTT